MASANGPDAVAARSEPIVRFELLGPLLVHVEGESEIRIRSGQQQALLALLLVHRNRPVAVATIIDELWFQDPPDSASTAVPVLVRRLRDRLGEAAPRLVSARAGYRLDVADDELDVTGFESALADARAALDRSDHHAALRHLGLAVRPIRGAPLDGIPLGRTLEAYARSLSDRVDEAQELYLVTRSRTGDITAMAELQLFAAEHPARETAWIGLLEALDRGRDREAALRAYARARTALAEHGREPGKELVALHTRILEGHRASSPTTLRPAQLPTDLAAFAGRERELAALNAMLDSDPAVIYLSGTGGIGKTTLAVHWAHRVRDRFPDGQLYVNLRGFEPGCAPADPGEALGGLLVALGVERDRIPSRLDARSDLFRRIADGRLLIVLDNARDAEQIRPLLPASASCLVLVTGRARHFRLPDAEAFETLTVEPLPASDARTLLAVRIGGSRLDDEPAAVDDLIDTCGGLPLALSLVAARATGDRGLPLDAIAGQLRVPGDRLDALDVGDQTTSVRSVFSWSYDALDPAAARLFRLLALHPGRLFGLGAAAALQDAELHETASALDRLTIANLLIPVGEQRWTFHDLLREFATGLVRRVDSDDEADAASIRLFDHYLTGTARAMDLYAPAERHLRPTIAMRDAHQPTFDGRETAVQWLHTERDNLVALAQDRVGPCRPTHLGDLARCLYRYLQSTALGREALIVHGQHVETAERTGDRLGAARAWNNLAATYCRINEPERAMEALDKAMSGLEVRETPGELARSHYLLGTVQAEFLGDSVRATENLRHAVELFAVGGHSSGQARALGVLINIANRSGRFEDAVRLGDRAAALAASARDPRVQGGVHYKLAGAHLELAQHDEACVHARTSARLYQSIGDESGESRALSRAAEALHGLGRWEDTLEAGRRALRLAIGVGDRFGQSQARRALGQGLRSQGRSADAVEEFRTALDLTRAVSQPEAEARAHDLLACALDDLGERDAALGHWRESLALYRRLDNPDASVVRQRIEETEAG